jgi:hypothetical protein
MPKAALDVCPATSVWAPTLADVTGCKPRANRKKCGAKAPGYGQNNPDWATFRLTQAEDRLMEDIGLNRG